MYSMALSMCFVCFFHIRLVFLTLAPLSKLLTMPCRLVCDDRDIHVLPALSNCPPSLRSISCPIFVKDNGMPHLQVSIIQIDGILWANQVKGLDRQSDGGGGAFDVVINR